MRLPGALIVIALLLLWLGGCSLMPPRARLPRYEDFGALSSDQPPAGRALRLRAVDSPAWLDNGGIAYRLLAEHPHQLRAYAQHRWVAPPPQLLAQSIRARLPAGAAPRVLRIRLLRFEQDFETADRARAVIVLRARLTGPDGHWIAARQFAISLPCAPDVDGAVSGLSTAARRASAAIVAWARSIQ
ncbi:MAG: ABC-type transport auxiliary lipoprotein family protein [Steroidobacteraceae bacterium]